MFNSLYSSCAESAVLPPRLSDSTLANVPLEKQSSHSVGRPTGVNGNGIDQRIDLS